METNNNKPLTLVLTPVQPLVKLESLSLLCLTFFTSWYLSLVCSGMVLVIWTTGFKIRKTVPTFWYLNLPVANFIYFVAFIPLNLINLALDFHWPFGKLICKHNTMVLILNMFDSVYIVVVIKKMYVRVVTLGVWGVALMIGFPYSIIMDTEQACKNESKTLCLNSYVVSDDCNAESPNIQRQFHHPPIIIARFLVLFAVPSTVIVSSYVVTIKTIIS